MHSMWFEHRLFKLFVRLSYVNNIFISVLNLLNARNLTWRLFYGLYCAFSSLLTQNLSCISLKAIHFYFSIILIHLKRNLILLFIYFFNFFIIFILYVLLLTMICHVFCNEETAIFLKWLLLSFLAWWWLFFRLYSIWNFVWLFMFWLVFQYLFIILNINWLTFNKIVAP